MEAGDSLISYYVASDARDHPSRLFLTYQDLLRDLPKETSFVHYFDGHGKLKGSLSISWEEDRPILQNAYST